MFLSVSVWSPPCIKDSLGLEIKTPPDMTNSLCQVRSMHIRAIADIAYLFMIILNFNKTIVLLECTFPFSQSLHHTRRDIMALRCPVTLWSSHPALQSVFCQSICMISLSAMVYLFSSKRFIACRCLY